MPDLVQGGQVTLFRTQTFNSPQNKITSDFLYCKDITIGGISKIWIASRSAFERWRFTETAPFQYGEITGNSKNAGWYFMRNRTLDANFTVKQELTPSRSYVVTLTMNFNKMEILKRDSFERIVTSRDAMFIVKDFNGKYWLLGEHKGMQIEWSGRTDNKAGINDYQLIATSRERHPVKEVSLDYIQEWVDIPFKTLCEYSFADVCSFTFTQIKQIPLK